MHIYEFVRQRKPYAAVTKTDDAAFPANLAVAMYDQTSAPKPKEEKLKYG